MTDQIRLDVIINANMTSLLNQMKAVNAETAAAAGKINLLNRNLGGMDKIRNINNSVAQLLTSSNQFDSRLITIGSHTDTFGKQLMTAALSGKQLKTEMDAYRNTATRATSQIARLANEQVRLSQTTAMLQGRSGTGAVNVQTFTPTGIDTASLENRVKLTAKEMQIFNEVAKQNATQIVNWGKNTQWAGRQLMVGFTIPLMIAGGLAAKTFMGLDEQLVRLQKVYGTGFTFGDAFTKQAEMVREEGKKMAEELARDYGIAGEETVALMADLASAGYDQQKLMDMTRSTSRLAMLGEVDRQEAMKATISMQTAFGVSTKDLADKVNFLNAVENQTSASLQDLTTAIPIAGPVIKGLGGSVEDLALYMVAMREGGISAAQGANALKSGLSSIIAPSKDAVEFMKKFGIDLPMLVKQHEGDLTGTLVAFQDQLKGLNSLAREQVITKLFGKYQFARMSAFFNNLYAAGSQTQRVAEIANMSISELGKVADQELKQKTESVSGRWNRVWQEFRVQIALIGEEFVKIGTWVVDNLIDPVLRFVNAFKPLQKLLIGVGTALAVIGPVVMSIGLIANMFGTIRKGMITFKMFLARLGINKAVGEPLNLITTETMAMNREFQILDETGQVVNRTLDDITQSMYNQQTATDVLTRQIATLGKEYAGLVTSGVTAAGSASMPPWIIPSTKEPSGFVRSKGGEAGWAAAHDIPSNMTDWQKRQMMQIMQSSMFGSGWFDQKALDEMAGGRVPNFGAWGFMPQSPGTNNRAGNVPQVFSGTIAREANQTEAEAMQAFASRIGVSPNKVSGAGAALIDYTDFKNFKMQLMSQLGVGQEAIAGWAAYADKMYADMRNNLLPAEEAARKYMQIWAKGLATIAESPAAIQAKLGLKGLTTTGAGSSWATPARQKMIMSTAQATGVYSAAIADKDMQRALLSGLGPELQTVMSGYSESVRSVMKLDTQINGLAKGISAVPMVGLGSEVELLQEKMRKAGVNVNQAGVAFVNIVDETAGVGQANKEYIAAIDTASGQVLAAAKQTAAGNYKLLPGTSTNLNVAKDVGAALSKSVYAELDAVLAQVNAAMANAADSATKIAALTEAGLMNEQGKLKISTEELAQAGIKLTDEQKRTIETANQLVNETKRTAESAMQATNPSLMGGMRGRMIGGGGIGSAAMMAGMMLPSMIPTGNNELLNTGLNAVSSAGMGAMMGSMIAPGIGTAIGGIAGAAIPLLTAAFGYLEDKNKQAAAEAAAEWEAQFGQIDLEPLVNKFLDIKEKVRRNLTVPMMEAVNISNKGNPDEIIAASDTLKKQVSTLRDATDSVLYARRIYTEMIAKGADPSQAASLIGAMMRQADKEGEILSVLRNAPLTQAQAVIEQRQELNKMMKDTLTATATNYNAGPKYGGNNRTPDSLAPVEMRIDKEQLDKMASTVSEVMSKRVQIRWDSGNLKDVGDFAKAANTEFNTMFKQLTSSLPSKIKDLDAKTQQSLASILGTSVSAIADQSTKGIMRQIMTGTVEVRNAVRAEIENGGISGQFAQVFVMGEQGVLSMTDALAQHLGPAFQARYEELSALYGKTLAWKQAIFEASRAADRASQIDLGVSYTEKYVDSTTGVDKNLQQYVDQQKTNINKLQKAEEDRIQAMQDAADAEEQAMQDEIDATQNRYDKEIQKIQDAEAARQKAFDKEQERFRRRQEMRNMQVSYDEAIANGQLYEAARIRMDMQATKKQNAAEDKNSRLADLAEKRIKALEKERDKKIKALQDALEAEQKANEAAIQSAQDAADAKVKAAEKANKLIEKANQQAQEAQAQRLQQEQTAWAAMLDGNYKKYFDIMKKIGLTHKQAMGALVGFARDSFSKMPDALLGALVRSIQGGDWGLLRTLLQGKIEHNDAAMRQFTEKYYGDKSGYGSGGGGLAPASQAYATGGFVSGPGSHRSDSIDAKLSNGEYVMNSGAVKRHGKSFFDKLNNSVYYKSLEPARFAEGGIVGDKRKLPPGNGMYGGALYNLARISKAMIISELKRLTKAGASAKMFGLPSGMPSGSILSWDGEPVDRLTFAQLKVASKLLGSRYRVIQGSFQPATSYSGTTHTRGGVVDVAPTDVRSVIAMQRAGFAAWYRGPGAPGNASHYSPHIHAISLFDTNVDPNAAWQRNEYINMSSDGLGDPYYGPHVKPIKGLRARLPSMRVGGKINYDNTIANLHKGEAVLTAPLTKKLEDNVASGSGNTYNFDVTIENLDSDVDLERAFHKFVVNYEAEKNRKTGRNRRIG